MVIKTPKVNENDIWKSKDTDDFLNYLKFEAYLFGLIISHFWTTANFFLEFLEKEVADPRIHDFVIWQVVRLMSVQGLFFCIFSYQISKREFFPYGF